MAKTNNSIGRLTETTTQRASTKLHYRKLQKQADLAAVAILQLPTLLVHKKIRLELAIDLKVWRHTNDVADRRQPQSCRRKLTLCRDKFCDLRKQLRLALGADHF